MNILTKVITVSSFLTHPNWKKKQSIMAISWIASDISKECIWWVQHHHYRNVKIITSRLFENMKEFSVTQDISSCHCNISFLLILSYPFHFCSTTFELIHTFNFSWLSATVTYQPRIFLSIILISQLSLYSSKPSYLHYIKCVEKTEKFNCQTFPNTSNFLLACREILCIQY